MVATQLIVAGLGVRFLLYPSDPHEIVVPPPAPRTRMVLVATTVGVLSGLLANGGGFLLAPLYVIVLRTPIKSAFGTSLVVAATLAVPGRSAHAARSHRLGRRRSSFSLTSIPLSYVGGRVAVRTQSTRLERWYGARLVLIGVVSLAVTA